MKESGTLYSTLGIHDVQWLPYNKSVLNHARATHIAEVAPEGNGVGTPMYQRAL